MIEDICFDTDRVSKKQYRRLIQSSSVLIVAAKQQSQLIGSAIVFFRKHSRIARLYSLAVLPTFRKHGVALAISRYYEKKIRARGCDEIRLEVKKNNRRAVQFYLKNGYVSFGEYKRFYEDGTDALRMKKILTRREIEKD